LFASVLSIGVWTRLGEASSVTTNISNFYLKETRNFTHCTADLIRGQLFALKYAFTLRHCMTQLSFYKWLDWTNQCNFVRIFTSKRHFDNVHCQNATQFSNCVVGFGLCKIKFLTVSEILSVETLLTNSDFSRTVCTFKRVLLNGLLLCRRWIILQILIDMIVF
jgi:hypothetical protein